MTRSVVFFVSPHHLGVASCQCVLAFAKCGHLCEIPETSEPSQCQGDFFSESCMVYLHVCEDGRRGTMVLSQQIANVHKHDVSVFYGRLRPSNIERACVCLCVCVCM